MRSRTSSGTARPRVEGRAEGRAEEAAHAVLTVHPLGAGTATLAVVVGEDGRVVGEVSGSTEVKDADGMLLGTASAEGSFDVERCF